LERLLAKGAEAELWVREWNMVDVVVKTRNPKKYRHFELDKVLRRSRTAREADILHRAKIVGVPTPFVYMVDIENAVIVMEYIKGIKIRDLLDKIDEDKRSELFQQIGIYSGVLHREGIIHGDLTTSNIIYEQKQGTRLVFIDFGLSEVSLEVEKRGVDLNLMNRMLTSTHYKYKDELLEVFKKGYRLALGNEADEVFERMDNVARRGRYIKKD
jgi:TP53 regulating kinase-like protein